MRRALICTAIAVGLLRLSVLSAGCPSYNAPQERPIDQPEEAAAESHIIFIECQINYVSENDTDDKEANEAEASRYADISNCITQQELDLLAALVYQESGGEIYEGQVAVAEVVLNRVISEYFPDTIHGVVFQKFEKPAFSNANLLDTVVPTQTQYDAVNQALNSTSYILDEDVVYFGREAYNDSVYAVIGNHVFCRIW